MPEEFDLDALIGGMNFKIGAVKMIDEKLEKQTSEILLNYFDGMKSQYKIPKKVDNNNLGDIIVNAKAASLMIGGDNSVRIDYDMHTDMIQKSKQGIKDLLVHPNFKSQGVIEGEKALENTRSALIDGKHHVLIAPHLVSGVMSNFDDSGVSFKLGGQTKLQDKVKQYFGSQIQFDCAKHENDTPEYHVEKETIVGKQKVSCSLYPVGFEFEPLYQIDLNLVFTIHPELDSDGKSLKAEFGDIQTTDISVHDKRMEVNTNIYDKMEAPPMMFFDPFQGFIAEMDLPFIDQSDPTLTDEDHKRLKAFQEIFQIPELLDKPQLDFELMPESFMMPLPPGLKFDSNSEVKVHDNGVIDISGDVISE